MSKISCRSRKCWDSTPTNPRYSFEILFTPATLRTSKPYSWRHSCAYSKLTRIFLHFLGLPRFTLLKKKNPPPSFLFRHLCCEQVTSINLVQLNVFIIIIGRDLKSSPKKKNIYHGSNTRVALNFSFLPLIYSIKITLGSIRYLIRHISRTGQFI